MRDTFVKAKVKMYAELIGNNKIYDLNDHKITKLNQLPFTSINYGTCTKPEGRMVIKALLEGSIEGVGKWTTRVIG